MKVAVIVPPLRDKVSFYPPLGALSVIAAAREDRHSTHLLDLDEKRCGYSETINKICELSPDVVGISAIVSTSYKYVKDVSFLIKKRLPRTPIVIGGGLSAASDTVLRRTAVDFVVHGEGELTFKELLKKIEKKEGVDGVKGLSFKKNNKIIRNPERELIKDLDILPFPDYDLLNLDKYILDMRDFVSGNNYGVPEKLDQRILDARRSSKFLRINISRGCVNRCTFCYRNTQGIRIHSLKYIGDLIEHIVKKYQIGHISFGDECFGPSKKWLWDFINMIREREFDLTFHITGMRVHSVDEQIMSALKEIGVWHIQFGFESGSQKILNIMEKNTTVEQNIAAAILAKKFGINTIPFIIIGYPGETIDTLYETIKFLKKAEFISHSFRPTFPMAMPGTPLYEYARLMGCINDEDKYLEAVSNVDTTILSEDNYFINYTDESNSAVLSWMPLIKNEINKYYGRVSQNARSPAAPNLIKRFSAKVGDIGLKNSIYLAFNKTVKRMKKSVKGRFVTDKRRFKIEFSPEGESLRNINKRLKENLSHE